MEFVSHFWRLLSLRAIEVLVTIQPKIECLNYPDTSVGRKRLAEDCYNSVLGRRSLTQHIPEEEIKYANESSERSLPG